MPYAATACSKRASMHFAASTAWGMEVNADNLSLSLVYNPAGPFLAPPRAASKRITNGS